jgi:hypothetical protein
MLTIATTTMFYVALFLLLGLLTSRRFCVLFRTYLMPDSFEYQARILHKQEEIAKRMDFSRAVIRRPKSFQDGTARPY